MLELLLAATAAVEIPTVTELLEERREQHIEQVVETVIETRENLVQKAIEQREQELEQERLREEAERQAEQERAEAARRASEREAEAAASEEQAPKQTEQRSDPEPERTTPEPTGDIGKWYPIARCESGYGGEPNWSLNTGNGYYGGLQFNLNSWQWVGGSGYPHEASREEQIYRAEILLERQGWGAWPVCSRKAGYR